MSESVRPTDTFGSEWEWLLERHSYREPTTMAIDPWSLAVMVVLLFVPVSGVCLYYAVRKDAAARGANGGLWGLAVLLLLPIAGPAYVVYRRRLPERTDLPDRAERRVGAVGIGGTTALVVASVLTPPDPYSVVALALPLIAVSVPLTAIVCYGVDPRTFGFWTP